MVLDTDLVLYILFAAIAVVLAAVIHLTVRVNKFTRGKSGRSLEETISKQTADIEKFKTFRKELEAYLDSVEARLNGSIRGIGTVRFNPFKGNGEGGQMSFATAFLDGEESGVIISTLNTRERMSIFAKQVKGGKTEQELTSEERSALAKAKERLTIDH